MYGCVENKLFFFFFFYFAIIMQRVFMRALKIRRIFMILLGDNKNLKYARMWGKRVGDRMKKNT